MSGRTLIWLAIPRAGNCATSASAACTPDAASQWPHRARVSVVVTECVETQTMHGTGSAHCASAPGIAPFMTAANMRLSEACGHPRANVWAAGMQAAVPMAGAGCALTIRSACVIGQGATGRAACSRAGAEGAQPSWSWGTMAQGMRFSRLG